MITTMQSIPEGFRAVRFTDDEGTAIYDGIVRVGAETWSGGLMPFVSVATMKSVVDAFHAVYPTPQTAHTDDVTWIDLVPMLGDYWDVVVYEADDDHSDGYSEGFPNDPQSWGTLNLLDEDDYIAAHPGAHEWIDLGAVGLVWHEVKPPPHPRTTPQRSRSAATAFSSPASMATPRRCE